MAGAADRQPFGDALNDAEKDRLEQFKKIQTRHLVNFYSAHRKKEGEAAVQAIQSTRRFQSGS